MLESLLNIFWSESFWLPPGIKWHDIKNGPDKDLVYPDPKDYWYQIPLVLGVLSSRFLLEKYCFTPLGLALGVNNKKKRKPEHIPPLEAAYRHRSADMKDVVALAKQVDMTERQVERWWRLRRNQDQPTKLVKFTEHLWKASFLFCILSYGIYMMWDKDWFWDWDKCYLGYPHHNVTNDLWWFYMIYTAYICSITLTLFTDVRRKDHWQTVIHHVMTGALVYVSWMINIVRGGAVAVSILDSVDVVLEVTKAMKNANFPRLSEVLFFIFVPIWIYTRFYLFTQFLYSTSVRGPSIIAYYPPAYIMNGLLYMLMVLTLFWTYLILKITFLYFRNGIIRDVRSSCSELSDDDANIDSSPTRVNGAKTRENTNGMKANTC